MRKQHVPCPSSWWRRRVTAIPAPTPWSGSSRTCKSGPYGNAATADGAGTCSSWPRSSSNFCVPTAAKPFPREPFEHRSKASVRSCTPSKPAFLGSTALPLLLSATTWHPASHWYPATSRNPNVPTLLQPAAFSTCLLSYWSSICFLSSSVPSIYTNCSTYWCGSV